MGMVLHAGGGTATIDDVARVETPEPQGRWCPLPHITVFNEISRSLQASGLQVQNTKHALSRDGQRWFSTMEVMTGERRDHSLVVGARNSHDQSFGAGFCCGSRVFVCDNLAFSAEVVFTLKHTLNLQYRFPGEVDAAIGKLGGLRVEQERRISHYKEAGVSDTEAHDMMIRAVEGEILPITSLKDVIGEWRHPQFESFKPRDAWSLFNAFTYALKRYGNPNEVARRSIRLHGLFDLATRLPAVVG